MAERLLLHITYAAQDEEWVRGVLIPGLGLSEGQYWTRAEADLGRLRLEELERAVKACRYTLLVASYAAKFDAWTNFAAALAQHAGVEDERDCLLVVTRDFDPSSEEARELLPLRQRCLACVDGSEPKAREESFARLAAQLALATTERPVVECPYPGLRVFSARDSSQAFSHPELFFGRDEEGRDVIQRLRSSGRVLLVGPSGCGKSSLVRARVLPALAGGPELARVAEARPAGGADAALRAALHALDPSLDAAVERYLGAAEPERAEALAALSRPGEEGLRGLLYIDPLEEVFIGHEREAAQGRAAFFARLAALWHVPGLAVLLSMRADFAADLMRCPVWHELKEHRVELAPLRGAGLRDAIVLPARHVGVHVEVDLVERLVREAEWDRASEALPLLQVALEHLWQHRQWRYLSLESYAQLVDGQQRGLDAVLSRHADRSIEELPEPKREVARRLLVELVELGEGRSDTRRRCSVSYLSRRGDAPTVVSAVLDHLAARRLISLGAEVVSLATSEGASLADEEASSHRYVDLAHDTLITGWPTLAKWLHRHRDDVRMQRRLEERAAGGGRLASSELPEFVRWLAWIRTPAGQGFIASDKLREVVRTSLAARRRIRVALAAALAASMLFAVIFYGQNLDLRQERTKTRRSISAATKTAAMVVYELDFKLRTVAGAAEVRTALLARAEALLTALRAMGDLGGEARTELLAKVGRAAVAAEHGRFEEAQTLYLEALETQRGFSAAAPGDVKLRRDVMVTLNRLGDVAIATSSFDAARDWYEEGVKIALAFAQRDASNKLWEWDLLYSYDRLGDVALATGDSGAATRWYEKAREGYEGVIARGGADQMVSASLAATYGKLGNVAIEVEDLAAARAWIARGLQLEERLVAADPNNSERLTDLALFHEHLGDVALREAKPREAKRELERAVEILAPLAARDASYSHWRRGMASVQQKLGDVAMQLGALPEARAWFEKALAVQADRVDGIPLPQQLDLLKHLGDVAFQEGKLPEAKSWYQRGAALGEQILDRSRAEPQALLSLVSLYDCLGDTAVAASALEEAQRWYERGAGLLRRPELEHDEEALRSRTVNGNKQGDLALRQGQLTEAEAIYARVLEDRERLLARYPGHRQLRRDLSISYQRLGNAHMLAKHFASAREWYEKVLPIQVALAAESRSPPDLYSLVITHMKLAMVARTQGLRSETMAHLDAAEALCDELRRDGAFASHAELRQLEAGLAALRH